jgi:anti-anti-sigma factor
MIVLVDGDPAVVRLAGDLDMMAAPAMRLRLTVAFGQSDTVVVDLARVRFIDSAGLGVIAQFIRDGQRLSVRSPVSNVRRVLETCGLGDLIE